MKSYRLNLASRVYKNLLVKKNHGFWVFARRVLIKLWQDPACLMPIHGRRLYLPLSHALPQYLSTFPLYDSVLSRLGSFLRQRDGYVVGIDVGANIGDTIAALFNEEYSKDLFLGIEPNPRFRAYLRRNWESERRVRILPYFCVGEAQRKDRYVIVEYNGTAEFRRDDLGRELDAQTLTQIISDNPEFEKCNIIKIDTDGHDFEVVQGAIEFIKRKHPIVFFECAPMKNENFIRDCIDSLKRFAAAGYKSFFAYDNRGYLIGKYSFCDLAPFASILFFQMTSQLFFIDVLAMREEEALAFEQEEMNYQVSAVSGAERRSTLTWLLENRNLIGV